MAEVLDPAQLRRDGADELLIGQDDADDPHLVRRRRGGEGHADDAVPGAGRGVGVAPAGDGAEVVGKKGGLEGEEQHAVLVKRDGELRRRVDAQQQH